jgi:hypothetical protein
MKKLNLVVRLTVPVVALVCSGGVASAQSAPAQQVPYPYAPQPAQGSAPTSYRILGQHVSNEDGDTDVRVGTTRITAANPENRDVVESRPEARRETEGRRLSAAPLFGFGTNDLGIGLGARAGYTFQTPFYLGATFLYHFGTDVDAPAGTSSAHARFMYPAVEGGYDFGIGPVLVRPYVGGGALFSTSTFQTGAGERSASEQAVLIYPGITAAYVVHKSPLYLGGDTRVLIPLATHGASWSLLATAGLFL